MLIIPSQIRAAEERLRLRCDVMKWLILFSLLFFSGCSSKKLPQGSYDLAFDGELWRSEKGLEVDAAYLTPRQKMLGDLTSKHLLGKSRKDVIAMLGEPSSKMDPDGAGPSLSYPTGSERGSYMRIDSEWLLIDFDSSDNAVRYSLRTD